MAGVRKTRPVSWLKPALREFEKFPEVAQSICLTVLTIAAEGGKADIAKPLHGLGSGVLEIALPFEGDAYRVVYAVQLGTDIWVVHAFQKIATPGIKTPQCELDLMKDRLRRLKDIAMKAERLKSVLGSGNVFRDLGRENADVLQLKAILAAGIIKVLDKDRLTVRAAHDRTGIAAADFSRIRNADLGRFTVDRLMSVLNRLGSHVEVKVRVRRIEAAESVSA